MGPFHSAPFLLDVSVKNIWILKRVLCIWLLIRFAVCGVNKPGLSLSLSCLWRDVVNVTRWAHTRAWWRHPSIHVRCVCSEQGYGLKMKCTVRPWQSHQGTGAQNILLAFRGTGHVSWRDLYTYCDLWAGIYYDNLIFIWPFCPWLLFSSSLSLFISFLCVSPCL